VVGVCVVRRISAKDLDADCSFLDLVGRSGKGSLYDVTKEGDGSFTGAERVIAHQSLQLCTDHIRRELV